MRCPSCGHQWPGDQHFCGSCGHALDTPAGFREERKVITVLFCDLVGSTARADGSDPEDVEALMRPYHECVRTELTRYGATVEKFIGDAVMAVFGAPAAHEDDGERAVRAGLRILEAIGELNTAHPSLDLDVRIGVATGEAIARLGARPERGEGLVVGDVVNTAARLQTAAAPGSVVVAEATHQLTAGHFDWLELEPVTVKGKAAPLPVWRPLAYRAGSSAHRPPGPEPSASRPAGVPAPGPAPSAAPFVGRDRDLAVLRAAFGKTVGERAPQLVTILGEAGIGKSRLTAELRRALQAYEREVVWRVGHCRPYGDGTSLSALADIVKAQAGVTDTDTTAAAVAKIRAALPDDERTDLEPRLVPLVGADPGVTPSRFESFSAWRRFIEIIAETAPAVLVVEDLHWAAPMLLDFVEDLVAGLAEVPVLVVATARPELLDVRPGWGAGSASLRLSPLPQHEVAAMLDALLGSAPNVGSRSELVARCGGVPLYAEQFAQLASQHDSATVPPTLAAVIGARLDTLNREHRAVLQTAAVAGSTFWADEVAVLTGAPAHVVTAALGALVRRQFLRRISPSTRAGQAEFVFWHDLVRDAAEARLTRLDRARRHLAVSQWWAAAARERSEEFADLIAHHAITAYDLATAAGDTPLAAQARTPACAAAAAAGARLLGIDTPGALRLLARAQELSNEDSPVRARILCWLGTALSDDRQFERAEQVLIEAVQQLEHRNDPLRVDAIFSLTVALFALGHDWEPALKAARRAANTLPPSRQAVRNLATLAMAELIGQNPQSLRNAVALADRAIQIAADHGTGGDAFAHIVRGRALLSLGDGRGMDELESRLDDALQQESGTWAVAARMWFAGALHHWRGPAAELKVRQEAMTLADNRGLQLYR